MERGIPMKKKGFTLVELIVVLVILAILAALLIPALTGYIDKANEEKLQATTRQVVVAAQSVVSEAYAQSEKFKEGHLVVVKTGVVEPTIFGTDDNNIKMSDICELAEVAQDITEVREEYHGKLKDGISWIGIDYETDGKLVHVVVSDGAKQCIYDGDAGTYTVSALS